MSDKRSVVSQKSPTVSSTDGRVHVTTLYERREVHCKEQVTHSVAVQIAALNREIVLFFHIFSVI